ncbi:MAG: hypothetical protein U0Q16_29710 [Bryobacteraceae bacterium]
MTPPPLSPRAFLVVLSTLAVILVAENAFMLVQLHRANTLLAAIRDASQTMQDDVQHVKEDVESNADALENLQALLEESLGK